MNPESLILIGISFLYAVSGIIVAFGYLPTIKDLLKGKPSASINSYLVWALCALLAVIYGSVIVSDLLLTVMSGLNLLAILTVLVLAVNLKVKSQRKIQK